MWFFLISGSGLRILKIFELWFFYFWIWIVTFFISGSVLWFSLSLDPDCDFYLWIRIVIFFYLWIWIVTFLSLDPDRAFLSSDPDCHFFSLDLNLWLFYLWIRTEIFYLWDCDFLNWSNLDCGPAIYFNLQFTFRVSIMLKIKKKLKFFICFYL